MIRHLARFALVLALTAILAAPAAAGWFSHGTDGNGEMVTTTYDLDACDAILLRCGLDVSVRFGAEQKVELTVDENLVELYEIEARGGTLVIDADKDPRPGKKARIEVTLRELKRLEVSGAGDIAIADYDGDELELQIDGAGDVEIDGRAEHLEITVNGAGDIDARRLEAAAAEVSVNGAGDVKVFASRDADVTINGVGDVDVYGKPEHVAKTIHGVGDIDLK